MKNIISCLAEFEKLGYPPICYEVVVIGKSHEICHKFDDKDKAIKCYVSEVESVLNEINEKGKIYSIELFILDQNLNRVKSLASTHATKCPTPMPPDNSIIKGVQKNEDAR